MKVLALSGSLRAASINTALLRASARLAPAGMQIEVYADTSALPLFNIDYESSLPPPVARLRAALRDTLKTMSAFIVEHASASMALTATSLTEDGMLASPVVASAIAAALRALHDAVNGRPENSGPSFPVR